MAPKLGKRKRQGVEAPVPAKAVDRESDEESSSDEEEDVQDIFRKHFEQHFLPIDAPVSAPTRKANKAKKLKKDEKITVEEAESEDDPESDESGWDGLSESDGDISDSPNTPAAPRIEVIEHKEYDAVPRMTKAEMKAFMSSKLPSNASVSKNAEPDDEEDESTEKANLKNDLALQRLLAESHLLESADNTNPTGKNRHKATDLRVMALGGKTSILKQEKMPMSHRKGIIAKQTEREETRRREARENGIILERPTGKKKSSGRRERGVGGPGIGRFSSATLKLSRKDIRDIEGPRGGGMKGKGKGKGRGRR